MATTQGQKRPNVLVIVADDLGFTDSGCFGGEIKTPNIDRLGYEGVRFTNFHASPSCAPSRSMLMTGTSAHLAGVGTLPEFLGVCPEYKGNRSYDPGHLDDRVVVMPELLRDAGYYNVMAGKWHLGKTKEQAPLARGFEKCFSLLLGGTSHHGWQPRLEPGDHKYRVFMHDSLKGVYIEDNEWVDELPEDFYSSDYFADRLIGYLKDQAQSKDDDSQPFFAYLPFQAPHFPLQVSKEYIQNYHGRYKDGPERLREERVKRMKELGLIPSDTEPPEFNAFPPRKSNRAWGDRDKVARERAARKMEVFSGMVENMDHNIGRVMDHLESTGQLDNTIIFFMSDNGAEGTMLEAAPAHRNMSAGFKKYYDNSLDNLGAPNSYCWYGNRWAQVGTAPSRLYKFFTHEGGIRVPGIVRYPKWKRQGIISHEYCTIMDILPTILDLAKTSHPGEEYQGRKVQKMVGKSWNGYMNGETDQIHDADTITGWEFLGRQALRKGDYKIVRLPVPWGSGEWELFDVGKDLTESYNLREQEPEKFKEMLGHWHVYAEEQGIVDATESVIKYFSYQEEDLTDGDAEDEY